MYRLKTMLLGLLAMMAMGSVVSATASAAPDGPWWRHPEAKGSQKQVKWPMNEEHAIKSENEGAFTLKSTFLGQPAIIICNKVTNAGWIWNGQHQGQDEAEVKFTECEMTSPCKVAVTVDIVKVYTELMWKYQGVSKELEEAGGQQKIYDVFAPTEEPNAEGKATFTQIHVATTICIGTYTVQAAGSLATFVDQHQGIHNIVWGTAAQVEPQNEDVVTGHLNWVDPNVKELHHQGKRIEAKLLFAGEPAELQGKIKVEQNTEEPFGAFNL